MWSERSGQIKGRELKLSLREVRTADANSALEGSQIDHKATGLDLPAILKMERFMVDLSGWEIEVVEESEGRVSYGDGRAEEAGVRVSGWLS